MLLAGLSPDFFISGGFDPHKHQGLVPLVPGKSEDGANPQKRKQGKGIEERILMFLEGGNLKVSYQREGITNTTD